MDSAQREIATLTAVDSSGEWMAPEDLCESARLVLHGKDNIQISLGPVLYLDASALQILLCLSNGLAKDGRTLRLTDGSIHMEKWFGYAGATALLSATGATASGEKASE